MITIGDKTIREVQLLSEAEHQRICDFLQGAVYCWCNNRKHDWFAMRDLMGGENSSEWDNTPLAILPKKHLDAGKNSEDAFKAAGIDSGWLLKKVIHGDTRGFETKDTKDGEQVRKYRWDKKQ